MILAKAREFGDVVVNKQNDEESFNINYVEKAEKMLFTFKVGVKLQIVAKSEDESNEDSSDDIY
jgi:hypothetical protein